MSRLSQATKGRREQPLRVIIYGRPGVGKSTFGADAPSPFFLSIEGGDDQLDVTRYTAKTWADACGVLDELAAGGHEYRTLVIDTLDALEPLCWQHVCATYTDKHGKRVETIDGFGYGDGYTKATAEWRKFLRRLDAVRERGLHIILVAHSHVKAFKSPDTDDYERYEMKLHTGKDGQGATAVFAEWADAVLFARHEVLTRKAGDRVKAVASDVRIVHTEDGTAWYAKNRFSLPPTLPLSWQAFADAVAAGRAMPVVQYREEIAELLRDQKPELVDRVNAAVAKAAEDGPLLARILNQLRATVAPKEKQA